MEQQTTLPMIPEAEVDATLTQAADANAPMIQEAEADATLTAAVIDVEDNATVASLSEPGREASQSPLGPAIV